MLKLIIIIIQILHFKQKMLKNVKNILIFIVIMRRNKNRDFCVFIYGEKYKVSEKIKKLNLKNSATHGDIFKKCFK